MSESGSSPLDAARQRAAQRRQEDADLLEGLEDADLSPQDPTTLPKSDPLWESPLMEAASHQDLESVRAWLDANADPNEADRFGRTALHRAAREAHHNETNGLEIVRELVRAGANINAQDQDGHTPLMYAAWHCQAAFVKAMINLGADVNIKASNGKRVLATLQDTPALSRKSRRTMKVLVEANAKR